MLSHGAPARTLGYQPALDGVRALAIIGVLLLHLNVWGALPRFAPGGHLGVAVFFVLSGYLITTLLLGEHDRAGTVDMPAFYARRAARLMPALLLLLLFHGLVWGTQEPSWTITIQIAMALAYATSLVHPVIFNVGPLNWSWSLSVEEHFYLFWPVTLRRALRSTRGWTIAIWCCGAMIVVAMVVRLAVLHTPWHHFAYYSTPARLDSLAIGCLAALVTYGRRLAVPVPITWTALGTLVLCYFVPAFAQGRTIMNVIGLPLLSVATAILILGLVGEPNRGPARLLATRPLVHIGKVSYGLYLWNLLAGQSMRMLFDEWHRVGWLGTFLGLAVTIVAVELSYWCVERPVLRWARRRLAARGKPAAVDRIPQQFDPRAANQEASASRG